MTTQDRPELKVFVPKRHVWLIVDSLETLDKVMAEFKLEEAKELDGFIDKSKTMEATKRNQDWAMRLPGELPDPTTLYTLLTKEELDLLNIPEYGFNQIRLGKVVMDRCYPSKLVFLVGEVAVVVGEYRGLLRTNCAGKGALANFINNVPR